MPLALFIENYSHLFLLFLLSYMLSVCAVTKRNLELNRNVWLLSLCQALLMTGNILLISVIALIGKTLAPSSSFITLPVALQFLGLMAATIPASLIMGKLGRRLGFSLGNVLAFWVPA